MVKWESGVVEKTGNLGKNWKMGIWSCFLHKNTEMGSAGSEKLKFWNSDTNFAENTDMGSSVKIWSSDTTENGKYDNENEHKL